ncbi:MAG: MobH family relaxase [Cocleimonas sp.]
MSSLSIRAYKLRILLNSLWSRIDVWKVDKSKSEREDEKRLDAVLHYPLKTASIPLVNIETLLSRQKDKIRIIERDIGLINKGCEFNFVDLVESTIRSYIGYCHLIPASEMDHHQYIGGLLEHSLDVSIRSLQFSMSFMLDQMGLIDEDQARRPRYEFAAWVCGLLHDAGKIISNVQVIGSNGDIWRPLNESIFDWAHRNKITEYTVVHQKERLHNDHETNSVHFLPLVLNDVAKNYLVGSHDDLYSMITQTLVHYHSYKGYLFNAVRKADSESTYDDYARVWLHDSSRKKSLTMGVVNAMRSLYSNWEVNKVGGDLFVFNGQIFIASDRPINDVIKKCLDYEIKLPTSSKALISILLDKRILSMVSDKSTYANLYLGEFTEADIYQFTKDKTGPMARVNPITVILVEWANFVVGDNPIPANVYGALRYNTTKHSNVHQLCNSQGITFVVPQDNSVSQIPIETSPIEQVSTTTAIPNEGDVAPKPKAKPKPKSKAKPKTKDTPTVPDTDNVESETICNTQVSSQVPIDRASSEENNEINTINVELKSSTAKPPSNDDYPWIIKPRRPKPIDEVLAELFKTPTEENIWVDNDSICVNLHFLIEKTNQNSAQIINAMSFLKLLKKNQNGKEMTLSTLNGDKVMYVLLDDDIGEVFKPVLSVKTPKASSEQQVPAESLGQPSPAIKTETIEMLTEVKQTEKSESSVVDANRGDEDEDDELTSVSKMMKYSEMLKSLKSVCPTLKNSELRDFCKAESITPIITEAGEINIEITLVQLDELKWKLRENNE